MNQFALKLIALVTMIIDHTAAVFNFGNFFRGIGRMAFPIYIFLVSEGIRKTSNLLKYSLRLLAFAIISEVPFDLCFHGGTIDFLRNTNVFYTLFLGVFSVYCALSLIKLINQTENRLLECVSCLVSGLIFAVFSDFLTTDYGSFGVMMMVLCYLLKSKIWKLWLLFVGFFLKYSVLPDTLPGLVNAWLSKDSTAVDYSIRVIASSYNYYLIFVIFVAVSIICIALYNGKQGPKLKWLFYVAYPLHLAILFLVAEFLV